MKFILLLLALLLLLSCRDITPASNIYSIRFKVSTQNATGPWEKVALSTSEKMEGCLKCGDNREILQIDYSDFVVTIQPIKNVEFPTNDCEIDIDLFTKDDISNGFFHFDVSLDDVVFLDFVSLVYIRITFD